MRARLFVAAGSLAAIAGCGPAPETEATATGALGQPNGDYPGYEERAVLYETNKARVNPADEGWSSFSSQPPLQWNYDLNRSARAHSIDMRDTPCFQHDSCDGTDTFARIQTFYTASWTSMGENIAAGVPDAVTVVYNWINEIGAAAGETGHREAIFSDKFHLMGTGFAAGGTRYKNYWTQDFVGLNRAPTRPRLTDGIHIRASGTGGNLIFGTTYYDAGASAQPTVVSVVIDGACTELPLVRGTPNLGAFEKAITLGDGCHGYYFVARSGSSSFVYPDSGGLQVGVGGNAASCALFAASVPAGSCDGNPAGTGGSSGGAAGAGGGSSTGAAGAGGPGGSSGSPGAAGSPGRGGGSAAGSPGAAGTSGAAGATGLAGAPPATGAAGAGGPTDSDAAGCGCDVTPGSGSGSFTLLALGALALARRRRRLARA
jgi:MYXO-CTERM domain-containing protein